MAVNNKQLSSQQFKALNYLPSSTIKLVSNEQNAYANHSHYLKREVVLSYDKNKREEAKNLFSTASETLLDSENKIRREEIVARRKLKVRDLRQKKKLEKQQQTSVASNFVLNITLEEYPDLGTAHNSKNKNKSNLYENAKEVENNTGDSKHNRGTEKSWKPKVKDPISINIGQVLQNKPERVKVVTKKSDPTAQRNLLRGNILDSDKPQMKKGKVRPDKQRKRTKLKQQILLERNQKHIIKSKQLENNQCIGEAATSQNSECKNTAEVFTDIQLEERTHPCVSTLTDKISSLLLTCEVLEKDNNSRHNGVDFINQQNVKASQSSPTIHSKKFREYCTNCLTEEVISSVCALLKKLAYFQDRTYARDPIKAQAKRRYVAGIKQTNKYLIVKKVKLLVIAPDLETNYGEGVLDNTVKHLKYEADNQCVPYVFGPKRSLLGKTVLKKSLISCVAVLSYEGAEEQFFTVLKSLDEAKQKYQALLGGGPNNCNEEASKQLSKYANVVDDSITADDVTISLLAMLKEDLSPADKLLNAISNR